MTKFNAKIKYSYKSIIFIFRYILAALQGDRYRCLGIINKMVDANLIVFKERKDSDGK
ncbi:hypothetical protein ACQUFQ_05445 [Enterococcus gallinarum]|uniref:hypothetical protein n=1 Tax=Enterococcus gallinarum TaxID=1353 RepID=UPI0030C16DE4